MKFKAGMQNVYLISHMKFYLILLQVYQFEKEMDELQLETKHMRIDLSNDAKAIHDSIFENYIPIFDMNSGVLLNNFLTNS